MEVAAEKDMEAIKDGRPAFMKLKMLKEVIGSTTIITALIITASSSHQQHQRVHEASYAYTIASGAAAEMDMIAISVDLPALMTLVAVKKVCLPALTAISTQDMEAQGWRACFYEAQDAQGGEHVRLSGSLCASLCALTA